MEFKVEEIVFEVVGGFYFDIVDVLLREIRI